MPISDCLNNNYLGKATTFLRIRSCEISGLDQGSSPSATCFVAIYPLATTCCSSQWARKMTVDQSGSPPFQYKQPPFQLLIFYYQFNLARPCGQMAGELNEFMFRTFQLQLLFFPSSRWGCGRRSATWNPHILDWWCKQSSVAASRWG